MRARPLIGVTTSITVDLSPERCYVNTAYLRAIQEAGGVPVLLPPPLDGESGRALFPRVHGLLLTGGGDVDPARYGESPHASVCEVAPLRDSLEVAATRAALDAGRPILAICRGLQLLNVALGGTLYQDVATDPAGPISHAQTEPRDRPTHAVKLDPGSRLAEVMGVDALEVNSMHHQAARAPGRGLVAVAWAPDQVVEGLELADPSRFVLAVQWHPEELIGHSEAARRLFSAFVAGC